jgi:hypothetical protein
LIFCFAVANYFAFSASFTLISLGFLLFLLAKSGYNTVNPKWPSWVIHIHAATAKPEAQEAPACHQS